MEDKNAPYRIKVKHYNKGGDKYYPQVRCKYGWKYLTWIGKPQWINDGVLSVGSEWRANDSIASHKQGQWKIKRRKIKTSVLYVY